MRIVPKDEYWLCTLNIHYDQIEKQLKLHKNQVLESLAKKWDKRIRDLIAREVDFEADSQESMIAFIARLFDEHQEEAFQFLYLTEFARHKRKEAVLTIAAEKLHPELLEVLELDERQPNAKHILWLILELFSQNPDSLFDVFLKDIEIKHSTGTWFQVTFDDNNIEHQDLAKNLDKGAIEKALARVDVPDAISCPQVIDNGNEKIIFLNAEITAQITKLRNSRNLGYSDDWIVMRFDKNRNRIRIAARSLDRGAAIVQRLIQEVALAKCSLHEEEKTTPAENIMNFVKALLQEKEDADALIEIELDNAPVDSVATKIRLKNDFSIARPFAALNGRYGWLDDINSMPRLLYLKMRHGDKNFRIMFDWIDSSPRAAFVRCDDRFIDSRLHEEFTIYMLDAYAINICCKRRRIAANGTA